jgi:hypothetical protein
MGEGVEILRFSRGKLWKSKMFTHFADVQLCPKTRASINSKLRFKFRVRIQSCKTTVFFMPNLN